MAMLLFVGGVSAKPVGIDKARRVAETYLNAKGMKNVSALRNVTSQTPFTEFYVFAAPEGGFIFVSADDCVMPVLGYSTTSRFETKDMPSHVRAFLEGYEKEIRYWKQRETVGDGLKVVKEMGSVASQWKMLTSGEMPPMPLTTAVAPLLTTSWGQQPYYNDLCPFDTAANARTVTGCVATATAQVMKYHNHPATGYGSHSYHAFNDSADYGILSANFGATTYQWSNMPNELTSVSSSAQVTAVATLMSHVGIADEMEYNIGRRGGSSAFNDNAYGYIMPTSQNSLMAYFKYRPDMVLFGRDDYSNDEYCALLRAELDQSRPILYGGRDYAGGHSFVIHGYDNNGLFCVNWGWRGSMDGYYAMGALNPGEGGVGGNATYTFNMDNTALIGIRPNTNWSTTTNTTVNIITNNAGGNNTISGGGSYAYGDTITLLAYAAEGYRFAGWSDGDRNNPRFLIANGGSYTLTGNFVRMQGDTLGYCNPHSRNLYGYTVDEDDDRWGIRLPASTLPVGHYLTSAELYVIEAGTYTLQVFTGTTGPTTLAASSTPVYIDATGENQWHTFTLNTPLAVDSTQNMWITFVCPDAVYPASVTWWSGNYNDGFRFDNNMTGYPDRVSFMIQGIFAELGDIPPAVDSCFITSFPYVETFDDTATYSCLRLLDANGDYATWSVIDSFGTNYSRAAFIMYAVEADDYLILPGITTPGTYNLSWKARAYQSSYPETYQVLAGDSLLFSETLSLTTLTLRSATFTVSAGDTVNVMFRYISDDMYAFFLDDITIDTASSTPNPPNPPAPEEVCLITSFPYVETFDDTATYSCLRLLDANGDNDTWSVIDSFGTNYSHAAFIMYAEEADDYLILPGITTPGTYNLSWKARAYQSTYPETYQVLAGDSLLFSETLSLTTLTSRSATFTVSAGDTVNVMFRYISDDMYAFFLDDITIDTASSTPQPPTQYTLTVVSNNNAWGTVTGGGTYDEGTTVTLTATANSGYHFVRWQDNNTLVTRTVTVTADATYTATFEADTTNPPAPPTLYTVTVNRVCRNCNEQIPADYVTGAGTYDAGTTVTLEGLVQGCGISFDYWVTENNDTIFANPYSFILDSDRTLTAVFGLYGGIDDVDLSSVHLYPNPATDHVTLTGLVSQSQVTLVDLTGRTCGSWVVSDEQMTLDLRPYARGQYFLRITSEKTSAVKKLVVK